MANPRVQPSFRGVSVGSFPEQRLVIEPTFASGRFSTSGWNDGGAGILRNSSFYCW